MSVKPKTMDSQETVDYGGLSSSDESVDQEAQGGQIAARMLVPWSVSVGPHSTKRLTAAPQHPLPPPAKRLTACLHLGPPPVEVAATWLGQLPFAELHKAMSVCHEWRQLACEDVRFHTLSLGCGSEQAVQPDMSLTEAQAKRVSDGVVRRCLAAAGPRLRSLKLVGLPEITAAALAPLRALERLEHVGVTYCRQVNAGALCAHLPGSVRSARLLGSDVSRGGLDALLARRLDLDLFPCKSCDGVTFDAMRAACSRCPTEYCLSCAQIYDCHGCAQRVCDRCVPRFVCECCEAEHCDCTARTACVHCGDEMCEGCADNAMLTCDHCGGAFCNHHEPPGFHTSLWCACGCAVTCPACAHLMASCTRCGDGYYAPHHALGDVFTRCERPGCDAQSCEACLDNADWTRCAGCGTLHCFACRDLVCEAVAAQLGGCACEQSEWRCLDCLSCCQRCQACLPARGFGSRCADCAPMITCCASPVSDIVEMDEPET